MTQEVCTPGTGCAELKQPCVGDGVKQLPNPCAGADPARPKQPCAAKLASEAALLRATLDLAAAVCRNTGQLAALLFAHGLRVVEVRPGSGFAVVE